MGQCRRAGNVPLLLRKLSARLDCSADLKSRRTLCSGGADEPGVLRSSLQTELRQTLTDQESRQAGVKCPKGSNTSRSVRPSVSLTEARSIMSAEPSPSERASECHQLMIAIEEFTADIDKRCPTDGWVFAVIFCLQARDR